MDASFRADAGNAAGAGALRRHVAALPRYWQLTYALVLAQLGIAVLPGVDAAHLWYALLLCVTCAAIYLLPVALTAHLAARLPGRPGAALALGVAWLGATLLQVLLLVDRTIHQMFAFHINGFVWNLVTTPGGIESMGGGADTDATFAAMAGAWAVLQAAALWLAPRIPWRAPNEYLVVRSGRPALLLLAALFAATLGERLWHGWAAITGGGTVLAIADRVPFYQPVTFRQLARRFGVHTHRTVRANDDDGNLRYPLQPLRTVRPAAPPNLVILVAESLRADMLTPRIMPNTWALAQRAQHFTRHYSGGNGTRMGMFSLFYGIYGNNWRRFLFAERPPLLMQRVRELDYALCLQTSARFTYPEFDRTIFAGIPAKDLHEDDTGSSWARDRRNVARFAGFLARHDARRPFMYFQFFESPHAKYEFPPESVIAKPYLPTMNYATLDRARDMPQVKNRYINSVHHLDQQLGRVFALLEAKGLLRNTIVVVTGDHGEEFMERGNWGHNSFFTDPQTRVPLVLFIPGEPPRRIDRLTSHLDVAPTLLRLLGVVSPSADFAHGVDLLHGPPRSNTVFADWNHLGVLMGGYKFTLPTDGATYTPRPVTRADDTAVADPDDVLRAHEAALWRTVRDANRFQHSSLDRVAAP